LGGAYRNGGVQMADSEKTGFTYPYPRPSLTVDIALVTLDAKPRVLLIRRKADPFAGKWALPGGFVDERERLFDAARRELKEETGIERADLEQLYAFGDPGRDPRGWTVSVVYMALVKAEELKPIAGDDAAAVRWFQFDELPELAFDHADILTRVRMRLADAW
jgi:8-oxo-dGTP diphosphatase